MIQSDIFFVMSGFKCKMDLSVEIVLTNDKYKKILPRFTNILNQSILVNTIAFSYNFYLSMDHRYYMLISSIYLNLLSLRHMLFVSL